jgi:hypothetical protein
LRSNHGSDFTLAKWSDALWAPLEKVLLAHKEGNLLGQKGKKMASGGNFGVGRSVLKKNDNKGRWAPKGIHLQQLHTLQGLTPTDIKFILRKVLVGEYTMEQLASIAKERKDHYRVIQAACEITHTENLTELMEKIPTLTKAWFNDRLSVFKGTKRGEDIPQSFVFDVRRELHTALRTKEIDSGASVRRSQLQGVEESDMVLALNYKQTNLPSVGHDITIVQDDVYAMNNVKPCHFSMVFFYPNYGLFPDLYDWDRNEITPDQLKLLLSLVNIKTHGQTHLVYVFFCLPEMADNIEVALYNGHCQVVRRIYWTKQKTGGKMFKKDFRTSTECCVIGFLQGGPLDKRGRPSVPDNWIHFEKGDQRHNYIAVNVPKKLMKTSPTSGLPVKVNRCQKPVYLVCWLLAKFSLPGDSVLDLFSGTGTMCVSVSRYIVVFACFIFGGFFYFVLRGLWHL